MSPSEFAYRKVAAASSASGIGSLIALYDTLAGNLRRAADAERNNDLGQRANELNHALMVIAFLEDQIDRGPGGELAEQLTALYRGMRRRVVLAQAKRSPEMLENEMAEVLKIRETWQQIEMRGEPAPQVPDWVPDGASTGEGYTPSSWSA